MKRIVNKLGLGNDYYIGALSTRLHSFCALWPGAKSLEVVGGVVGDVMNSIKINDHQMGKFNFDTVLKFTPSRIYRHMDRSSGTGTRAEDEDKCMSIGGRRLLRRLTRGGHFYRFILLC